MSITYRNASIHAPARRTPWSLAALLVLNGLAGCGGVQQPRAPESTTVTYRVPSLAPVHEGSETQEKGGVVIQMAPEPFKSERQVRRACEKAPPSFITVGTQDGREAYDVRETPEIVVVPPNIRFNVRVTNKMDQVLKLEGTIFKLNVDGREIAISEGGTKAFVTGILTPNERKDYVIDGPEWRALPENATIAFSIYSIPVDIDKAGQVAERGNFDWTFKLRTNAESSQEQVTTRTERMTPGEAAESCHL